MSRRYDAIVAGGGPAGAAAAIHLARGGAHVLLCDKAELPSSGPWRDKACGGGLTPRGLGALERLKVDLSSDEAISVGGLEMFGRSGSVAVSFPPTQSWSSRGIVARRGVLDRRILEGALSAGAELRTARVVGPLFEDGVCRGVRVRFNGSVEDIQAEWTIAADGATSSVARAAGLAPSGSAAGGFWYAAMRAYFAPVDPREHDGDAVLEFYPLQTPSGRWLPAYGWVFPLPDGSANVGVDLPHSPALSACPPLREAFEAFVERIRRERRGFEAAEIEEPPHGALLPEATRDFRLAAPGLLAVGDAAGMITPYSGEGIAYGLEGAELAAEAILGEERPSEAVRRYERSVRDGYGFQFASSFRIMKAMRRPALAGAAAAVGFRSRRALRAGVRVMGYLIEEPSTVSRGFRRAERAWLRLRRPRIG